MNKNQIFIKSGTEYKKMTKELLTASNLAELIGDRHKMVGIKPNLVSPSDPSEGGTTHPEIVAGILEYLKENGCTDCTLSDIRLRYYAAHGNELCWRYPISDGIHAGAFILATKDGYLSLPYNSMDEEDYEILVLDDAVFHDLASLTTFLSDWEDFSADLTDAMREMCRILEGGEEDA